MPRSLNQSSHDPQASSRGYTLSVLLVMLVVAGTVTVQKGHLWAPTQLNREREAELIYRGEHLARGIALFRQKTGRYPTTLAEVEAISPRIIRKAYKDPMTAKGEWTFVYNVPTAPSGNNEGLPIVGLRSKSNGNSIKLYQNKSLHSEWEFSALDPRLGGQPGQQQMPGGQQIPNSPQQGGQSQNSNNSENK
ncbi:MAG: hypothetical protein FWG02_10180 [Holophagaceae bacterium]|nr:hypothetical protein [Holophagaceae bacterium]